VTKIASDLGTSLATLSIAWVLANPTVTSAILGASRPDQLTDTVAAVDLDPPDDAKVALDELTRNTAGVTPPDNRRVSGRKTSHR
jgi:aryl-alcohol dehydrogenase-like predicted oxidoreductase